MRVALHSVLREGQESNYGEAHATVPLDLAASLLRAGIRDWTMSRSGRHLFHLADCDDFQAAMSQLDLDPVNDRWQEYMARFVDHFETVSDGFKGMMVPTVWSFRALPVRSRRRGRGIAACITSLKSFRGIVLRNCDVTDRRRQTSSDWIVYQGSMLDCRIGSARCCDVI